jgi:hypothetical protein
MHSPPGRFCRAANLHNVIEKVAAVSIVSPVLTCAMPRSLCDAHACRDPSAVREVPRDDIPHATVRLHWHGHHVIKSVVKAPKAHKQYPVSIGAVFLDLSAAHSFPVMCRDTPREVVDTQPFYSRERPGPPKKFEPCWAVWCDANPFAYWGTCQH